MRRRPPPEDPRITVARLVGTAHRVLGAGLPADAAAAAIHEITRDPTVLAEAAGAELGAWQASPVTSWQGRDVADLLARAGADETLLQDLAREARERMARRNRYGA